MPILLPFAGKHPRIHRSAWLAPNVTLIGDVTVEAEAAIYFGSVLRADAGPIVIGARTNIQDNCTMHADAAFPCVIGAEVTVGHTALLHGCRVADQCLIGMGSILLSGAHIGTGSLVAAGTVVKERAEIPANVLVAGVPGQVKRELKPGEIDFAGRAARYVANAAQQATRQDALTLAECWFE